MRLTLEITSGPAVGRKFHLRVGQRAEIGRTEWADFSVPDDPDLAEVHFGVHCAPDSCNIRQLASASPTLLNGVEITEAVIADGDDILAGQTTLRVVIDSGEDAAETVPAAIVAAGTQIAEQSSARSNPQTPTQPSALELAKDLELGEPAVELARDCPHGDRLLALLKDHQEWEDAIQLQAHLLPKPAAIWWACLCLREIWGSDVPTKQLPSLEAAELWVRQRSEDNRRAAQSAAEGENLDGPACWVAMAAFWSEGSIAPANVTVHIDPDPKLCGQTVGAALKTLARSGEADEFPSRAQQFLDQAAAVSAGKIPVPQE